jgi:phosphoglycerate kinase
MNLRKYNIKDIQGKNVLLRCDLDVSEKSDFRLIRAANTINDLLSFDALKITIIGHKGRPRGKKDENLSLKDICSRLDGLVKKEKIQFVDDINFRSIAGKICTLENLRFWPEEESCNKEFGRKLLDWGDVFVNDAFANSHREHSSMVWTAKLAKNSFAGKSVLEEVVNLEECLNNAKKPFVVILGGSKISTKLPLLERLISVADIILIGGGLANTIFKSRGIDVGKSLIETEMVEKAGKIKSDNLVLPVDVVLQDGSVSLPLNIKTNSILDLGPETTALFSEKIGFAGTILWNGPMGKFEDKKFALATLAVARAVAENKNAHTVVGGGDTIEAIDSLGLMDSFGFVSAGGGAMLTFLSGERMPGLEVLEN